MSSWIYKKKNTLGKPCVLKVRAWHLHVSITLPKRVHWGICLIPGLGETAQASCILWFLQHHSQELGCQTRNLNTIPLISSGAHRVSPSTCVLASPLALSEGSSSQSPSSRAAGPCFLCRFSLELPSLVAFLPVSVSVAPAPVPPPPSEPAQLSHEGLREAKHSSQDRALLSWAQGHSWFWKMQERSLNPAPHISRAYFGTMLEGTCNTAWVGLSRPLNFGLAECAVYVGRPSWQ